MKDKNKLLEVGKVFFKLGCFAFGGPAVHIAIMEQEVVHKRKWIERDHFLDLIGATNLIPGPNSTEMTMHCGHKRAGFKGLIVAGLAFIIPAIVITGMLAYIYVKYGQLPEAVPFISGIKPAVLAIIASAIIKLGKKALKSWELGILGILVLVFCILGINEILALLGAGIVGSSLFYAKHKVMKQPKTILPFFLVQIPINSILKATSVNVFLTFLKVGAILYGSGYVLFAYLDAELVETGRMTRDALLDAIAVGQFTPGPVLSTATFIGYQLNGFWGAIAASTGIFLPSFIFVAVLNPLIPKMRQSKFLSFFLDSVNVAAVAIMAGVLYKMTLETVIDWKAIIIAIISIIITFGFKKVSVMYTILGGGILGYLLTFI